MAFWWMSARYKDPKTNQLSKEKLEKQYTFWDRWFSGAYPLSFGEKIRYYLDQHLIVMNLINDALVRFFPGKKNAFGATDKFLAFQDETQDPGGLEAALAEPGGL